MAVSITMSVTTSDAREESSIWAARAVLEIRIFYSRHKYRADGKEQRDDGEQFRLHLDCSRIDL